jgi:glutamate--cysteine ligase
MPEAVRVLLIAENHTRNTYYLENLCSLSDLLGKAGLEVRLGSLRDDLGEPEDLSLPSGRSMTLEPVTREGRRIAVGDFSPCMVLLNNDMASGRPKMLEDLEQLLVPPLDLGWADRLKSEHFNYYDEVAGEFSRLVDIDPWLINPLFRNCGEISFMKREGEECLADNVAKLLKMIRDKYHEYGVDHEPFVMVKADAGTYGMGIMTVRSPDEVQELNRKQRTRMASAKGGREVSKVILQEGVYTFETWGQDAIAEPVVYLIDHHVVGGFYRVHAEKGVTENLNAPGMRFEPLAFAESCITPNPEADPNDEPNRFYAYGVIARLATLAAAREIAEAEQSGDNCL